MAQPGQIKHLFKCFLGGRAFDVTAFTYYMPLDSQHSFFRFSDGRYAVDSPPVESLTPGVSDASAFIDWAEKQVKHYDYIQHEWACGDQE